MTHRERGFGVAEQESTRSEKAWLGSFGAGGIGVEGKGFRFPHSASEPRPSRTISTADPAVPFAALRAALHHVTSSGTTYLLSPPVEHPRLVADPSESV